MHAYIQGSRPKSSKGKERKKKQRKRKSAGQPPLA